MTHLSEFLVFSTSAIIRLTEDAFEGDFCQTVNSIIEKDKPNILSSLNKRRPSHNHNG